MNFLRSKEAKSRAQKKKWASWNREEAKMQAWHNRLGEDSSESSIINTHTSEEDALARGLRSSWAKQQVQQPTPQQIQQTRQNRIKMLERNNKERLRNRLFPKQNQQSIRNGFRNTRRRSRNTSRGRNTRRRSIRRNSNNNNTQGWCEWVRDIVTGKRTKKCYSNKKRN